MLSLEKGIAVPLVNANGAPIVTFKSGVRWTPAAGKSVDLDYILVAVTNLGSGFTVSGDANELKSPYDGGAIAHSGNQTGKTKGIWRKKSSGEQTESVTADLLRVFTGVTSLVGMVTAADASSFRLLTSALFELIDGAANVPLAQYLLPTNVAADTIVAFVARRQADGSWTIEQKGGPSDLVTLGGNRQEQLNKAIEASR